MSKLRADFHSHSHYSRDSVLGPEAYVRTCLRKGLNCVAVTDHNEIEGAYVIRDLAQRHKNTVKPAPRPGEPGIRAR